MGKNGGHRPIIVISGYYGAGNTGDEAILAAAIGDLRREMPGASFVVLSRDPALTTALHGVPALQRGWRRDLAAKLGLLRRADLFICGGGGLLQDSYPKRLIPRSVLHYLAWCALAKLCGCPVMLYAQGVGPLNSRLARFLTRAVAGRMDLISVRDKESADLLSRIGLKKVPIHVTADPAVGWKPKDEDSGWELLTPQGYESKDDTRFRPTEDRYLVIAVRPWPEADGYLQGVALVADRAAREWGLTPVLVPFGPADTEISRQVAALTAHGTGVVILPATDPAGVYRAVAGAELVLGMRLHALVFAATAGVPMVGLAYDPKVAVFLDGLGLPEMACPLAADADTIWQKLSEAWERRAEIKTLLARKVAILNGQARLNAVLARELIEKRSFTR